MCAFRIQNKQPEFWDPDTGKTTPVGLYETTNAQTILPVQLGPSGSVFVVFRKPATGRRLLSVAKNGTTMMQAKRFAEAEQTTFNDVRNNFTISVWVKPEMDIMLSTRGTFNDGVPSWTDYYAIYPPSGEALYGQGHETAGLTAGRNGVADQRLRPRAAAAQPSGRGEEANQC